MFRGVRDAVLVLVYDEVVAVVLVVVVDGAASPQPAARSPQLATRNPQPAPLTKVPTEKFPKNYDGVSPQARRSSPFATACPDLEISPVISDGASRRDSHERLEVFRGTSYNS